MGTRNILHVRYNILSINKAPLPHGSSTFSCISLNVVVGLSIVILNHNLFLLLGEHCALCTSNFQGISTLWNELLNLRSDRLEAVSCWLLGRGGKLNEIYNVVWALIMVGSTAG